MALNLANTRLIILLLAANALAYPNRHARDTQAIKNLRASYNAQTGAILVLWDSEDGDAGKASQGKQLHELRLYWSWIRLIHRPLNIYGFAHPESGGG